MPHSRITQTDAPFRDLHRDSRPPMPQKIRMILRSLTCRPTGHRSLTVRAGHNLGGAGVDANVRQRKGTRQRGGRWWPRDTIRLRLCGRFPGVRAIEVPRLVAAAWAIDVAIVEAEPGTLSEHSADRVFEQGISHHLRRNKLTIASQAKLQMAWCGTDLMTSRLVAQPDATHIFNDRRREKVTGSLGHEIC